MLRSLVGSEMCIRDRDQGQLSAGHEGHRELRFAGSAAAFLPVMLLLCFQVLQGVETWVVISCLVCAVVFWVYLKEQVFYRESPYSQVKNHDDSFGPESRPSQEEEGDTCQECGVSDVTQRHCDKCGKCWRFVDHHCRVTGTCVHAGNRAGFLKMLTGGTVGITLLIWSVLYAQQNQSLFAADPMPSILGTWEWLFVQLRLEQAWSTRTVVVLWPVRCLILYAAGVDVVLTMFALQQLEYTACVYQAWWYPKKIPPDWLQAPQEKSICAWRNQLVKAMRFFSRSETEWTPQLVTWEDVLHTRGLESMSAVTGTANLVGFVAACFGFLFGSVVAVGYVVWLYVLVTVLLLGWSWKLVVTVLYTVGKMLGLG
eukprot:TRINITY_DN17828_c0_g1_i1.p1 TRINITY_DN17828_c0_g1~~TRINITY_DN17828_c0_g1_i1.p1  ORF type:complete len:370 (+),score=60.30 TRINITY_DN17828_c0_g1_i1:128-1237(+)